MEPGDLDARRIARRLFNIVPPTPVDIEILVPLNRRHPIRVSHEGIAVLPSEARLQVVPHESTRAQLEASSKVARRAIEWLGETPLAAAGVNCNYAFDTLPETLISAGRSPLDDRLAEMDRKISVRVSRRVLPWNDGVLNMELGELEDASGFLNLNFHRQSSDRLQLITWLERVDEMVQDADRIADKLSTKGTLNG